MQNHVIERGESIKSNFEMYKLENHYVDVWMGDEMNTPLRKSFMFDAIVTDRKHGHFKILFIVYRYALVCIYLNCNKYEDYRFLLNI